MDPSNNPSIYIGDLDDNVTEEDLHKVFSSAGAIQSVTCCRDSTTGKFLNYGFVNFVHPQAARAARDAMKHVSILGKQARVMPAMRDASGRKSGIGNVFVKNLHQRLVDDKVLHSHFVQHGPILSAKVARNSRGQSRGFGFVQFERPESADSAVEKLNDTQFGGQTLSVSHFVPKQKAADGRISRRSSQTSDNQDATGSLAPMPSGLLQEVEEEGENPPMPSEKIREGEDSLDPSPILETETASLPTLDAQDSRFLDDKYLLGEAQIGGMRSLINKFPEKERKLLEEMLFEFKKLGKAQKTNLRQRLHDINSFSLIPFGFQKNKAKIVSLCEEIMNVVRCGKITARDTATKMMSLLGEQQSVWQQPQSPLHMVEVLRAFASGRDNEVFVDLPGSVLGKRKQISLRDASLVNEDVCARTYMSLVKAIQAQILVIEGSDPNAIKRATDAITQTTSIVGALFLSWTLGQSTTFSSMAALKTPVPLPQGKAMRKVLAALDPDLRARLWDHWDQFCDSAPPLEEKLQTAERHFESCLANLNESGNQPLAPTLEAVKDLMARYHDMLEQTFLLDSYCAFQLDLVQLGNWLAFNLPDDSVDQMMEDNIYPFLSFAKYFQSEAIPRA